MTVRSHLPWPLRWAVAAVAFGFSAALALWAFELGKDIAGLDREARAETAQLRVEVERLRAENARASSVANTAESLLKSERAAQEQLARSLRQLEEEAQVLRANLGFFERLLPATGDGLSIRGVQADAAGSGQLRYQALVMQSGKEPPEFAGRLEVVALGSIGGKGSSWAVTNGPSPMVLRQYLRVEGVIEHPAEAVIKSLRVRVLDNKGVVRATQSVNLPV